MRRVSNMNWSNSAVVIRIKDGEFYLIGVRNAYTDYVLLEPVSIDREDMIVPDTRIGYISFLLDIAKKNAAQRYPADNYSLIEVVNCYERNGKSNEDIRDIFVLTDNELSAIIDALRDGDYVFVMTE